MQKHENTLEFHSRLIEAAEVRFCTPRQEQKMSLSARESAVSFLSSRKLFSPSTFSKFVAAQTLKPVSSPSNRIGFRPALFDHQPRLLYTKSCCLSSQSCWILSCRSGGIGRRAWFRSMYSQGCGGSSPFFGTKLLLFYE
jgi:hypothetical protein